jgi:hypothetical protein
MPQCEAARVRAVTAAESGSRTRSGELDTAEAGDAGSGAVVESGFGEAKDGRRDSEGDVVDEEGDEALDEADAVSLEVVAAVPGD